MFLPFLMSRFLNEYPAHGFCSGGKEVPTTVPALSLFDIHQPNIRLVNQGGRLQRLPRILLRQSNGGKFSQLAF
jgi:hypothetical protein